MKAAGIIAEYNPFHRGHAYQIEQVKKQTGADYVIAAMSGNFVQRGAPALMDKFSRAEMALGCGADLVLELPVAGAAASAEYFAKCGVFLLHNTGVATHLCFGTESSNFDLLKQISHMLIQPPDEFSKYLREVSASGLSFPLARSLALERCLAGQTSVSQKELRQTLSSPNNILAIEYLKALKLYAPELQPCPILRQGRGYHDTVLPSGSKMPVLSGFKTPPAPEFSSASAIRSYLRQSTAQAAAPDCPSGISGSGTLTDTIKTANSKGTLYPSELAAAMPDASYEVLTRYPHPFLWEDDFSPLVHYKLLVESAASLAEYADSSADLANRLHRSRHEFVSWNQFCGLLKSKNNTYSRISRLLLHLILDIKQEDYARFSSPLGVPYLRVLGFCKSAAPLLAAIRRQSFAPLITSAADGMRTLPPEARLLLEQDIRASDLYLLGLTAKGGKTIQNEFRHPLVIL